MPSGRCRKHLPEVCPTLTAGSRTLPDPSGLCCRAQAPWYGQARSVQRRQQLAAKHRCQSLVVEQVVATLLGFAQAAPQAVFGIKGRTRHGQMHMGVKLQSPGVGVQHANSAGLTQESPALAAELGQRLPGTLHLQTIDRLLMAPGQGARLPGGQREGDSDSMVP